MHILSKLMLSTHSIISGHMLLLPMQVVWLNNTHVSAMWMPRLQTEAYLTTYDVSNLALSDGVIAPVSTMTWIAPVGWVEIYKYLPAFEGNAVLMLLPRDEKPHFVHLALVYITAGNVPIRPTFLTKGEWEVSQLVWFAFSNGQHHWTVIIECLRL